MKQKLKFFLIWFFAFLFTAAIAIYQRMTGPTYEIRGKVLIGENLIKYKLIRTWDGAHDAYMFLSVPDRNITGELKYKRFKSFDDWIVRKIPRVGGKLFISLPHLPPAGKVMYQVTLNQGATSYLLNNIPAILRYKGFVPPYILWPHILFIFLAMMFSTLTGLMIISKSKNSYLYAWITFITLAMGGMILGPIVQKFSFDAFWTGWPFGHDLTDNKALIAFIFWGIAVFVMTKNRQNRLWPILASVILLVVFLIPHSVLGSEIDFTKEPKTEITR